MIYRTIESQLVTNATNIVSGGEEQVIAKPINTYQYDHLIVTNLDNVDIEVKLDNDSTRSFFVGKRSVLSVGYDSGDDVVFRQIVIKNIDTADATAGKIKILAERVVVLDG